MDTDIATPAKTAPQEKRPTAGGAYVGTPARSWAENSSCIYTFRDLYIVDLRKGVAFG